MTPETELAWAAGFFDGEGCTGLATIKGARGRPEGYLHLRLSVVQVRREPLDRFHAAVGSGHIKFEPRGGRASDIYRWTLGSSDQGRRVLGLLWPYLSLPKREQAQEAIATLDKDLADNPRDHYRRLRERIVALHAEGLTPLEIASKVGLARRSVYYHLAKAA